MNLEPSFREQLSKKLLSENIDSNMAALVYRARSLLIGSKQTGRGYWTSRGWSNAYAQAKIVEARKKQKPRLSPFSNEYWRNRINPSTNEPFTVQEAELKRNSLRPIRAEYWLARGFNKEEAEKKALVTKTSNNKSGAAASAARTKEDIAGASKRCLSYWLVRGFSKKEAVHEVKKLQATFSLEKCILKHGEELGSHVWQTRQDKWQNTLNLKTPEEKTRICKAKIAAGYTISKAEVEIFEELRKNFPNIKQQIPIFDKNKSFIFDLGLGNKLIEYNGTYWHADPRVYESDALIKSISASDVWVKDKRKITCAQSQGYDVLVIWEKDFKEDKNREIEKCMTFLQQ